MMNCEKFAFLQRCPREVVGRLGLNDTMMALKVPSAGRASLSRILTYERWRPGPQGTDMRFSPRDGTFGMRAAAPAGPVLGMWMRPFERWTQTWISA